MRKANTSSSALKLEVNNLMDKLKNTVIIENMFFSRILNNRLIYLLLCFKNPHFIRCIQPNDEKQNGTFNEELVLRQLNTSSITSYAQFMCFGYPKRIASEKLIKKCEPIEKRFKCMQRPTLYSKILLSRGFKQTDFRIGKEMFFFRSTKFNLLEKLLHDLELTPEDTLQQIKRALIRSTWRCAIFLGRPKVTVFRKRTTLHNFP